ncbi:MAG TPA: winged helix-turn-helix domain-containing protein, partial [Kiloniellales bacterium]|nr:winged helix-turn-helix domain-containing protein [Kiloniellales bacterium]
MAEVTLRFLGGFEALAPSGAPLSFQTKKTKALLAYLAARPGRSYSRSQLATLLWGETADEQARASLRQTLTYLRKSLASSGLEPLVVQGDLISIDPATVRVDVAEVESLCAQGSRQALTEVGTLYQG